jgi:hypothetical protein
MTAGVEIISNRTNSAVFGINHNLTKDCTSEAIDRIGTVDNWSHRNQFCRVCSLGNTKEICNKWECLRIHFGKLTQKFCSPHDHEYLCVSVCVCACVRVCARLRVS